jgi:N-dimethylarginine dimethylaminohydrolase
VLAANIQQLIAVEEPEARRFACNAVVVGRAVVTNEGCPRLHEQLCAAGFQPLATPLGEFVN